MDRKIEAQSEEMYLFRAEDLNPGRVAPEPTMVFYFENLLPERFKNFF